MGRSLVAYFSATGTTARAAKALAEAVGADLFEIEPAQAYSMADLDWHDRHSRSSLEMNDEACRPDVASHVEAMDAYDTVYVGFPVWWYVEPRIIDTFLETYDFAGKTIVPFATSGGSGLGKTAQRMAELCPQATIKRGGLLNDRSEDAIRDFIAANDRRTDQASTRRIENE